jgi:hypothetical protein
VNGGAWQTANTANVSAGATVNLGPQPLTGTWSWTGPNGFTSTSREIDGIPLSVGTNSFVATYTNPGGCLSTETFTITVTALIPTFTDTPVPPTPTPTSGFTGTQELTLYFLAATTGNVTNSPHPFFQLVNTGSGPLNLNNVEVRYWFNCDCTTQTVQTWVDWAGLLPAGTAVTGDVVHTVVPTALGGQTDYVSYKFTGNLVLQPGQMIEVQSRFNLSDWSNMLQDNDWSYTPDTTFTEWSKITGYLNGSLVFGEEPTGTPAVLASASVKAFPNPSTGNGVNLAVNLSGGASGSTASVKDVTGSSTGIDPSDLITFKAYSLDGQMVWTTSVTGASFGSSGEHSLYWNEKNLENQSLASGLYIVTVTITSHGVTSTATSKVLIIK